MNRQISTNREVSEQLTAALLETYDCNRMSEDYLAERDDGATHAAACSEVLDRVVDWLQGDGNHAGDFAHLQKELDRINKWPKRDYQTLSERLAADAFPDTIDSYVRPGR